MLYPTPSVSALVSIVKYLFLNSLEYSSYKIQPVYKSLVFHHHFLVRIPAGNYKFKVNSGNTRARCEICSKLTIKTLERRYCCCSGVFIVSFEHISHLVLVSIVNFEQVNAGWGTRRIHQLNFLRTIGLYF